MKILLVDDETTILETVQLRLRKEGYTVFTAESAEEGMRIYRQTKPDLLILDVMLPNRSGFDLCRAIRKDSEVPILFLTARTSETDRISGLDLGADDYIVKPFTLGELTARIKAVLRRSATTVPQQVIEAGDLRIDSRAHVVTRAGQQIALSPKEFALLAFFANHAGQVFSREVLLDRVWGPEAYVTLRTVDVHVRWIREHIETEPSHPQRLLTIRGVGYKFVG